MDAAKLFQRMDFIIEEIQRLDRENPTGPDEETDPRIKKLLEEGLRVTNQLDPLMREKFRDDPAALAEWDEIMHMLDGPDEDCPENSGA